MRCLTTPDPLAAGRAAPRRFRLASLAAGLALRRPGWGTSPSPEPAPANRGRGSRPPRRRPISPWPVLALLSLLAAVTEPWTPAGPRAGRAEVPLSSPQALPSGSPSRRALLQSAFWWAQAVQVANDEYDQASAALKAWDPEAVSDEKAELPRLLASDTSGCLLRARRAAVRAAALGRTPKERTRAARLVARLECAAGRREAEPRAGERARGQDAGGRGSSREREPPVRQLH